MFGEILQKFVKRSPITVRVQGLMERLLNAEELDRWFGTARDRQYTSSISASIVAVYDKLKRLEPSTARALMRRIGAEAGELIERLGGANPALLPDNRVLDG